MSQDDPGGFGDCGPGDGGARADAEPSRDRILDTAIELFARFGVEGVSLSLLAEQVGLHKSTLFHHFRGKAELAEAALNRALAPLCEIVEDLPRRGPWDVEQLVEMALRLDDHFAEQPAAARFLLRALLSPEEESVAPPGEGAPSEEPVQRIYLALGAWIESSRAAGAIRPVRVRHTVINLLGLCLLYPAIAEELGRDVFRTDPRAPRSRSARREELAAHLRAALRPDAEGAVNRP